jgi:hypothetical protein
MSSINPEDSTNSERKLTPAEAETLGRLEAIAQTGLGIYVQVGNALAEIRHRHLYRDRHPSFEAYVRERWGVDAPSCEPLSQNTVGGDAPASTTPEREPRAPLRSTPCEALARACEQTISALADDDRMGIEIRLAIRKQGDPPVSVNVPSLEEWRVAAPAGDELLSRLRRLLTQANGTIGEVAHQLETRAADIDDGARVQLRDDVLVLDGELAVVKALLAELIDWDSELKWLLDGELPPLDPDIDAEDDD